jgi:AraC-like DNA-binding protein
MFRKTNLGMDSLIANALLHKSSGERAQLIGRARQYIQDDNFVNLLNLIDINDRKGDQIRKVCRQFTAFTGIRSQVEAWLRS